MKNAKTNPGAKFSRIRQPAPCPVCAKLTTGIDGTDLCRPCHDEAGLENEHSDRGHDAPVDGCPLCPAGAAPWTAVEKKIARTVAAGKPLSGFAKLVAEAKNSPEKREVAKLVAALRAYGWTPNMLETALGRSHTYVNRLGHGRSAGTEADRETLRKLVAAI